MSKFIITMERIRRKIKALEENSGDAPKSLKKDVNAKSLNSFGLTGRLVFIGFCR